MQPDTLIPDLSSPQSWNRYSYVTNRPVNFSDPTGHDPWWSDAYFNLGIYVSAGIYQQNMGVCSACNLRPRWFVELIYPNDDTRSIGPAAAKDIEMKTDYGAPFGDDPKDPRGYGLGLSNKDQDDMEVARLAMSRRITLRLQACIEVGCSATDQVVVAALAANNSIAPDQIKQAFRNKDNFTSDGNFDWLSYQKKNEKKDQYRNRHTLLKEFVNGIDEEFRSPRVDWDYIQGLIDD